MPDGWNDTGDDWDDREGPGEERDGFGDAGDRDAWDPEDLPEEDADVVDDPEVLRRAEEAVAAIEDAPARWAPTDAEWVPVAIAPGASAWALDQVACALAAEGIPAAFDPYDPRNAVTLPYGLPVEYRVIVPVDQAPAALRIVTEIASGGAAFSAAGEPAP